MASGRFPDNGSQATDGGEATQQPGDDIRGKIENCVYHTDDGIVGFFYLLIVCFYVLALNIRTYCILYILVLTDST